MSELFKLEFYVPDTHLEAVKKAVFAAGGGRVGNYECCSWETAGTGQFLPVEGSEPFIGSREKIEKVREYKVEMVCSGDVIREATAALLAAHPYETPAFQYWKVNSEC